MSTRPSLTLKPTLGLPFTPAVRVLLVINLLSFVFIKICENKLFLNDTTYGRLVTLFLGLVPEMVKTDLTLWQPFTYLFIHTTLMHFIFNMLGLWWFGADVESEMGSGRFVRYYFFCGLGAALVSVLFDIPTIGASGAIYGLLLAYGFFHPDRVLYIYFIVPVKAKYCVLLFGALEMVFFFASGPQSGINHLAHLGGLLFGGVWMVFTRNNINPKQWWKTYQKQRIKRKLRVVRDTEDDAQTPYTIH